MPCYGLLDVKLQDKVSFNLCLQNDKAQIGKTRKWLNEKVEVRRKSFRSNRSKMSKTETKYMECTSGDSERREEDHVKAEVNKYRYIRF